MADGRSDHTTPPRRLTASANGNAIRLGFFVVLAASAVAFDLSTKDRVFAALGLGGRHLVWSVQETPVFSLTTSLNRGALFGIGQNFTGLFSALSLAATAFVLYWQFFRVRSWWLTVALGLIQGGILGNLYDRLGWHGIIDSSGEKVLAVRDFLFFELIRFPIFNFADSFLVIGAAMLLLASWWELEPAEEETGAALAAAGSAAGDNAAS